MSQDCVQSDWCDYYDCYDQSDDELDYDQIEHIFNQMEATQNTEAMINDKLEWIEKKTTRTLKHCLAEPMI